MNYRPYFIHVSGSIIALGGKNYTQNWVAGACLDKVVAVTDSYSYNKDLHAVSGDLVFNKYKRAVPYAMYIANGSVGVQDGAAEGTDLICASGFFPAFAYFHEYITEVQTALVLPVRDEIRELYYNGLYISALGVFELFLCDFLLCGVFSHEAYYNNALVKLNIKADEDQYVIEKKIKESVYSKVFHRFERIEKLFEAVFDFGFPDYQELGGMITRRHDIVHRYGLSKEDRMSVCNATKEDVAKLVTTIVRFVEDMKRESSMN